MYIYCKCNSSRELRPGAQVQARTYIKELPDYTYNCSQVASYTIEPHHLGAGGLGQLTTRGLSYLICKPSERFHTMSQVVEMEEL